VTVRRGQDEPPPPDGEDPGSRGKRPESHPESWVGLIRHAIGTWSTTARFGLLVVLVVGVLVGGLWILQVDLVLGPFEISRN